MKQGLKGKSALVEKGKTKKHDCPICSGPHLANQCSRKRDHCFRCGRPGHLRFSCRAKLTEAPLASGQREEDNAATLRGTRKDNQTRDYPTNEDPSDEDPSEEDLSEGEPSEAEPVRRGPPEDDLEDMDTLPSKYQSNGSPDDDDSAGPRAKRCFAVRSWPAGCGRGPHVGPVEDALSREG